MMFSDLKFGLFAFLLTGLTLWLCGMVSPGGWSAGAARLSLLRAIAVLGTILVVLTEILSHFHALTPLAVDRSWAIVLCAALLLLATLFVRRVAPVREVSLRLVRAIQAFPGRVKSEFLRVTSSPLRILFWVVLAGWLLTLLVIALAASPNNHDSMTYRLPRVMNWAANESVDFFPTEVLRQNHRAPFAEWVLLHVFLLSGGDQLFNLFQWLALGGCCVVVYELAAMFQCPRAGRYLSVVFAVTLPMAILQATSTQSDLVSSFFFLSFLVCGMRMAGIPKWREKIGLQDAAFCGLTLGLALLTRSPNFLWAGIFSLWFGGRMLASRGWRALPAGVLCGALVALILLGHSLRNAETFGHPLGPSAHALSRFDVDQDGNARLVTDGNRTMNARFLASNLVRNAALHFQTPIHNLNTFFEWGMWKMHGWIGLTLEEPDITWPGTSPDLTYLRHEDVAGNLPQALLFLAAMVALLFRWRTVPAMLKIYGLCLALTIVIFAWLLRWEPWHPRIELPLFFALCPFAVAVLKLGNTQFGAGAAAVALCYGLPFLVDNESRPLFGPKNVLSLSRESQYFRGDTQTSEQYREVTRFFKSRGYKAVGLVSDVDSMQYPIWPLYRKNTSRKIKIYEVNVGHVTPGSGPVSPPDAVISLIANPPETLTVEGTTYSPVWKGTRLVLYEKGRVP